jgi:hypothetical protein
MAAMAFSTPAHREGVAAVVGVSQDQRGGTYLNIKDC